MAAVTSVPEPVQGCTSEKLGAMRYHAMASVDFAERWFPEGMTPTELREAPMLTFDRKDDMQDRFVRKRTRRRLNPPRNYVPGALEFVEAARREVVAAPRWSGLVLAGLHERDRQLRDVVGHPPVPAVVASFARIFFASLISEPPRRSSRAISSSGISVNRRWEDSQMTTGRV